MSWVVPFTPIRVEVIQSLRGEFRRAAPEQIYAWAFAFFILLIPPGFDGTTVSKRRVRTLVWSESLLRLQSVNRVMSRGGGDFLYLQWPERRQLVVCSRELREALADDAIPEVDQKRS